MTIDNLVNLYRDSSEEVLEFIVSSLNYLKKFNEELYRQYIEIMCDLKITNPEFKIEFNDEVPSSQFSSQKKTISIKHEQENPIVLFHELAHAVHYFKANCQIPPELETIVTNLKTPTKINDWIMALNYIKIKLNRLLKAPNLEERLIELQCLLALEDIIDALEGGQAVENGLCFIKDNTSLPEKARAFSGHGEKYYQIKPNIFHELFANYVSIRSSEQYQELYSLLCFSLEEDLLNLLEKMYLKLYNSVGTLEFDNSKNVMK